MLFWFITELNFLLNMIFVRCPFPCDLKVLDFESNLVNADQIEEDIGSYLGCNQFSLFYNGRKLQNAETVPQNSTVQVTFPLPGGKGGFGSMLRAIGAQIEKTTNREACRDLSGRRLRDINEEQRLKKWIAKEAEREAEKVKRRKARIERLKTKAPHKFFDFEYEKKISELPERIDEALSEGLQKVKTTKKRPHESQEEKTGLPKKSWLIDDMPITSSESDSDEVDAVAEGCPKKMKMVAKESLSGDYDQSESSLSCPGSSKDSSFIPESSIYNNMKTDSAQEQDYESSTSSDNMDIVENEEQVTDDQSIMQTSETDSVHIEKTEVSITTPVKAVTKDLEKKDEPEPSKCETVKAPEDDLPVDLLEFQNVSELEALGLDRLKSALMTRGLKCGGSLSDRAQRLWKIRGLERHQYPTNLLVKNKK